MYDDINAEKIRMLLRYDPQTGIFTWRVRAKGKRAGSANDRYRWIKVAGRRYLEHRLAWFYVTGEWPANTIDHVDGNPLNNRFANLREATQQQQNFNSRGRWLSLWPKGVTFDRRRGRFRAQLTLNGKNFHLGMFDTPEEANAAYLAKAQELHGKFFRDTIQPKENTKCTTI